MIPHKISMNPNKYIKSEKISGKKIKIDNFLKSRVGVGLQFTLRVPSIKMDS